jgi:hypothetical protein
VTAVPRPQQARTRGQSVVLRTDSEQGSSPDTPPPTTTGVEIISTTSSYYYYYHHGIDPPTATTTTTTTSVEIISTSRYYYYYRCRDNLHLQNQKELRSIVPRENNIACKILALRPLHHPYHRL